MKTYEAKIHLRKSKKITLVVENFPLHQILISIRLLSSNVLLLFFLYNKILVLFYSTKPKSIDNDYLVITNHFPLLS